jgi:hypothetical protein
MWWVQCFLDPAHSYKSRAYLTGWAITEGIKRMKRNTAHFSTFKKKCNVITLR